MLRRFLSVLAVIGLSLLGFAPAAAAAPDCYAPATLGLTSAGGPDLIISGGNFGCDSADSVVTLTVTYGQASGLRNSAGLKAVSEQLTANPDEDGNFSTGHTATQAGTVTVLALGRESGKSASSSITLGGNGVGSGGSGGSGGAGGPGGSGGAGGSGGGGGVIVGGGSSGSTDTGGLAYTGQGSSGSTGTGGLAYTGASIAGPVIIGIAALLGGLSLLFFGTRGVARRKHAGTSSV